MYVVGLVALAALFTIAVPRWMCASERLVAAMRAHPRAGLALWQAVTLAGALAAVCTAPAVIPLLVDDEPLVQHRGTIALAAAFSGLIVARLLIAGHQIGHALRVARRRHRALIDLLGEHDGTVRVLAHETPTAYCVPGHRGRVVLSRGTLDALTPDELEAVLEHERAHLGSRHDLLLEFFTVVHRSAPPGIRCEQALREVHLLVELLADGRASRAKGPFVLARALVALASAQPVAGAGSPTAAPQASRWAIPPGVPDSVLAMQPAPSAVLTRLEILRHQHDSPPARALTATTYAASALVLAAPVVLVVLAWA